MKMVHQRKIEAARELYGLSPSDENLGRVWVAFWALGFRFRVLGLSPFVSDLGFKFFFVCVSVCVCVFFFHFGGGILNPM